MRKHFIYLSLLFCFQLLISQESEIEPIQPKSNISNLSEPYVEYYDNGKPKVSGQKREGVKIGEWKDYFDNGNVSKLYSYTEGKMDVPKKYFFKSGSLKYEITGNKDSVFKTEYHETGEIYSERQVENGNYKEYYKNGKLRVNTTYVNSDLSGLWIGFSETGEKEWEVNYLGGYLNGTYKQFYKNGKIKVEGKYFENEKQGKEKHFSIDGKLDWEGFFDKGIPYKKWKKYNEEGKVIANNKFKEGVLIKHKDNFKGEETSVPNGLIEVPPVYPGCEKALGTLGIKKCMNRNMKLFIGKKFNTDIALQIPNLSGIVKISIFFKIDKTGEVKDIKIRSPHELLEEEARRIISSLPKMISGTIRGEKVTVPYYVPLKFAVK